MTILRALFVLEEQTEVEKLKEVIVTVRKDVEAGLAVQRRARRVTRRSSARCSSRWCAPARSAACSRTRCVRIADQLEKEDALRRQVASAMVYPTVVLTVALLVMLVLVVYIVPVFAGVLQQFGTTPRRSRCRAMTQVTVDVSHAVTGYWYVFIARRRRRSRSASAAGSAPRAGGPQWDAFRLKIPFKIGGIVAEDLDRPLGAHVLGADRRRRAADRGARHHRPDRRQRGRRARDERRHRLGQARRHDRRAAQAEPTSSR